MISNTVRDTLQKVFSHPAAGGAVRSSGVGYAAHEAGREIDVFHGLKASDDDHDGKVDLRHPGHSMAVPSRRTAEFSGCPQVGSIARVDRLFLTPDSHGQPTFETFVQTSFTPDGIVKREASFGGQEVVARTVSVNHLDPSLNYVEEFRLAR
ncbi:hypothetical protein IV102_09250 [bacterium]|nr:hypothetical protein [bacterium]